MRFKAWPAVSLLALLLVAPAYADSTKDDSMLVLVNPVDGVYHAANCPKATAVGLITMPIVTASQSYHACSSCCPVCKALAITHKDAAWAPVPAAALASDGTPGAGSSTSATSGTSYSGGRSSGGTVHVRGYRRKDGTYVKPHTRKKP